MNDTIATAEQVRKSELLALGQPLFMSRTGTRLHLEGGCQHPDQQHLRPATPGELQDRLACWTCLDAVTAPAGAPIQVCQKCNMQHGGECW